MLHAMQRSAWGASTTANQIRCTFTVSALAVPQSHLGNSTHKYPVPYHPISRFPNPPSKYITHCNQMDIITAILSCLTGDSEPNRPHAASNPSVASDILTILLTSPDQPAVQKQLNELIHPANWTESLARAILHGLEDAIRTGKQVGGAAADALQRATSAAYEFAKEHPVYTTILALGVLVILAPWVIEVLGFGELGPVEGSFAAWWQSLYGDVPAGAVFGYFQRLGMLWKRWGKGLGV
ncbi:interferon alpha-inducible IFI6/IFI27 family protein [Aspergillus clavatus NRRL 1]|uniref:Lincomycin-condensing protein lmbA n=1 Tax=Aspergillus clavatus (strain ATCC 1007 / CBS 513.65 / DSM 816 / NCTC 3887 / NRRL 1 / QM 1276 / 107) TaxID=344612 RepID=A1CCR4_ASPCL|nr:uncharacterized protein ACLA_062880 [Aspergillus clavatus NRRL 1]EAW12321.1 conserved hypothetical protein [Aspergillus clavatus NRRL 1]